MAYFILSFILLTEDSVLVPAVRFGVYSLIITGGTRLVMCATVHSARRLNTRMSPPDTRTLTKCPVNGWHDIFFLSAFGSLSLHEASAIKNVFVLMHLVLGC